MVVVVVAISPSLLLLLLHLVLFRLLVHVLMTIAVFVLSFRLLPSNQVETKALLSVLWLRRVLLDLVQLTCK